MPNKSQEITGKNWRQEINSTKADLETVLKRNEFYEKSARLRLAVDADLIEVVKHPESKGLKTQEDLNKAKDFSHRVRTGETERLYNILDRYFREIKIESAGREKEIALSLFCLTQQGVNVDLIVPSWKVEIKSGQLFITKSTGESAVNGAYLRTIPGVTDKEEQPPEHKPKDQDLSKPISLPPGFHGKAKEGWTPLPPIPGLPAKPQEEKKKTKKSKPKAEPKPKPSDILETF